MVKWINDMSIKGWFGAVAVSGAIFISLATPAESAERGPYIGASAVGTLVSDIDFNNNRGGTTRTADFDAAYGGLAHMMRPTAAWRTLVMTSAGYARRWNSVRALWTSTA